MVGYGSTQYQNLDWIQDEVFVSDQIQDEWWNELENMKQGERTVAQLQLHLEELFIRLSLQDNTTKKRYLLKSLEPSLAYEVEKAKTISFLTTIQEAKRIESLKNKYSTANTQRTPTYLSSQATSDNSSMATPSLVNSMDQLAHNLQAMKIHLVQNPNVIPSNQPPPPPPNYHYQQPRQQQYLPNNVYPHQPTQGQPYYQPRQQYHPQQGYEGKEKKNEARCYNCNEIGHLKWQCPSGPPRHYQQPYYYQQPTEQRQSPYQPPKQQNEQPQPPKQQNEESGKGQGQ
ncbi:hypothetical protein BCR42DRAFT_426892 [Absidia repens]|uniref:CCHC-type domain-containing protein n=1 Tax=Absidia repens TaxID=90262 RepID=A0A1X2I0F5_9FUNG|nr:hypothetical protein BCR42DRAFT_426892 [Absidia repens]